MTDTSSSSESSGSADRRDSPLLSTSRRRQEGGDGGSGDGAPTSGPADPAPSGSAGTTGEGVDRRIEKKLVTPRRVVLASIALLAVVGLAYLVWTTATGGQALNVDREKVTISAVERGPFQEFISVTATVRPERTVYLDAVEGGRVEELYVREGAMVEAGQPILRLSNNDLRLSVLNSEAQVAEQQSNMEQLKLQMEQQSLNLQQQLAQMEYQIRRLTREFDRQERLYEKNLISQEEYLNTKDELEYQQRRLDLTRSAYVQDSLAQQSRLANMRQTEQRLQRNYDVLRSSMSNLRVTAPISGQLTALDAEIGQIINSGARLGQVDKVDSYKLRAQIDEFYIERVRRGQVATTQAIGGTEYEMEVTRVYPEVESGQFEVDLRFTEDAPSNAVRRGQSIRLKLELGSPEEAILLSRGGFYQSTGGNWAFVLTEGGDEAVRREIRLGRQNPNHFEVQSGLQPGDRVVTSSYDTFGDADRLVLTD
ncbi:MAG: HlyD family efflux transporter periplasmic adaptor subunit [Bacteroidetes bacterium]|jgi:HlyD family secretion protein|nr:HlyD family efflux transporter periplasmic adaptor subunit [Bacteroidota bacterium]